MSNIVADIVQGATSGPSSIVSSIVDLGRDLIDRVFPDKEKQAAQRAEAEAHLLDITAQRQTAILNAVSQVDAAQSEVNKIEAQSSSTFKSGWRPAIGWVCAGALALNYWPRAIASVVLWALQAYHSRTLPPYPDLGVTDLLGLTASLLGMSTLRSIERQKGVS